MKDLRSRLLTLFSLAFLISFAGIPLDTSYTTELAFKKVVKRYPDAKIVPAIITDKLKAEYNLVYATIKDTPWGVRDLHLDVFRPSVNGRYPALIMIHGGGWRSGNKSMEHAMAVRIAESGFVTIPVEYRLSLEASYPNAIYDIKSAIRWVKQHADRYGIDTTRIAIEGNSAGGQLATLVGMTNGVELFEGETGIREGKASINAIVDIDGVVNFIAPGSLKIETSPGSVGAFWLGGTFEEKPSSWKEASPAYWVGKNSVPLLIIQGTEKRFTAGMYDMRAQMDQFGVYSEYQIIENSPHTFWLFDPWFEPTVNHTIRFLKKVFD